MYDEFSFYFVLENAPQLSDGIVRHRKHCNLQYKFIENAGTIGIKKLTSKKTLYTYEAPSQSIDDKLKHYFLIYLKSLKNE